MRLHEYLRMACLSAAILCGAAAGDEIDSAEGSAPYQEIEFYSEFIRLAQDDTEFRLSRGRLYFEIGDHSCAFEDFTDVLYADTAAEPACHAGEPCRRGSVLMFRGAARYALGDIDSALADFETAHRLSGGRLPQIALDFIKDDIISRTKNASGTKDKKDTKESKDKKTAAKSRPPEAMEHFARGLAYFFESPDHGTADFEAAKKIDPSAVVYDHMIAAVYFAQGQDTFSESHYKRDLAHITELIRRRPNSAEYYGMRARLHSTARRHAAENIDSADINYKEKAKTNAQWYAKHAIPDLNKAVQLTPKAAEYLNERAEWYIHTGNFRKARADHFKAMRLMEEDAFFDMLDNSENEDYKASLLRELARRYPKRAKKYAEFAEMKHGGADTDQNPAHAAKHADTIAVIDKDEKVYIAGHTNNTGTTAKNDLVGKSGHNNKDADTVKFKMPPLWAWVTTDVLFLLGIAVIVIYVRHVRRANTPPAEPPDKKSE